MKAATAKSGWKAFYRSTRLRQALRYLYLVLLVYILVFWRAFWTPDVLFFMLLLLFLLYGQARQFLVSFGPFVLLLLTYDSLRGLIPFISKHVHFTPMVHADVWLGAGVLPTQRLQQWLYHGHLQWYDFYLYFLYMCHFLAPLLAALVLWKFRPQHFNRFIMGLLFLSYAGFVTYILFPAAPPWMASQLGYIYPIHRISSDVWWSFGVHNFPTIYAKFAPNETAAMPSLHAAYPTLITLFIGRAFGWRWALALLWYPLSVWFGVVYMGEHYLIDVIFGVAYAVGAYFGTNWLFNRYAHHARAMHAKIRRRYAARRASAPNFAK